MRNAIRRSHQLHSRCGDEKGDFKDDHEIEKTGLTRLFNPARRALHVTSWLGSALTDRGRTLKVPSKSEVFAPYAARTLQETSRYTPLLCIKHTIPKYLCHLRRVFSP